MAILFHFFNELKQDWNLSKDSMLGLARKEKNEREEFFFSLLALMLTECLFLVAQYRTELLSWKSLGCGRNWFQERKHLRDWKKKILILPYFNTDPWKLQHPSLLQRRVAADQWHKSFCVPFTGWSQTKIWWIFLTDHVFAAILLMPLFGVGRGVSFIYRAGVWGIVYPWRDSGLSLWSLLSMHVHFPLQGWKHGKEFARCFAFYAFISA